MHDGLGGHLKKYMKSLQYIEYDYKTLQNIFPPRWELYNEIILCNTVNELNMLSTTNSIDRMF